MVSNFRHIPEGYDIEPEGEAVFKPEYYNKKIKDVLDGVDKVFVDKKVIVTGHPDTAKFRGEKIPDVCSNDIIKKAIKISDVLGKNKNLKIHYSDGEDRMEHTKKYLEEYLKYFGINGDAINTEALSSIFNDTKAKDMERIIQTGKTLEYLKSIGTTDDIDLILAHTTFWPGLNHSKKGNSDKIILDPNLILSGEMDVFDFKNGNLVLNEDNIFQVNTDNYKQICDILRFDDKIGPFVEKFENKEIDLVEFQNKINLELELDKEKKEKYKLLELNKVFDEVKEFMIAKRLKEKNK